jgi:hypothetical protein
VKQFGCGLRPPGPDPQLIFYSAPAGVRGRDRAQRQRQEHPAQGPDRANAHGGEVRIGGQRIGSGQNPSAAGLLSFLAQKNHVNFSLSVRELVVMGSFRRKRFFQPYTPADYGDADRALEALRHPLGRRRLPAPVGR